MAQRDFRFAPPALAPPPAAEWMLVRALGPPGAAVPANVADIAPEAALAMARRFEVAARIAARQGKERLAAELGAEGAQAFERERWATAASGVRLLEAITEVEAAAAALGLPLAWLKHAALEALGLPVVGRRGACDVDVLVPAARAGDLQQALVARGFTASREGAEHQLPALAHPEKGAVEIHRHVPGVRPGGAGSPGSPGDHRSATLETLAAAGLLAPVAGRAGAVHVPVPAALAAHLLVHGLAQHGFWPRSYSLLKMVADLTDLGLGRDAGLVERAGALLGRDVSPREVEAAAGLCRALEAGGLPAPESPAGRLLAHILAGRLDADYEKALRLGVFHRQPSDRPEAQRLARSLGATVFLTRARVDAIYGPPRGPLGYLGRQLARPFDLLLRLGMYGTRRLRVWRRGTRDILPPR